MTDFTKLTPKEAAALAVVRHRIEVQGRSSATAAGVATLLGISTRSASATLSSLANKGRVIAHPDGFVQRTFYTLPKEDTR